MFNYKRIKNALIKRKNKLTARNNLFFKNEKSLISFTFDDFPLTAVTNGERILNDFNRKGTYFISLGLLGGLSDVGLPIARLKDLEKLILDGHEIGDHTYHHLNAFEVDDIKYEESIIKNQEEMLKLFPSYIFKSFAYPFGYLTPSKKRIVRKFYKIARGIEEGYNKSRFDSMLLKSYHLAGDKNRFRLYKNILDKSSEQPSWLIFFTHEVQSNPTEYGCDEELFRSVVEYSLKGGFEILSIKEVFEKLNRNKEFNIG